MTWDEAALERVFDEVSEGLARDLLLYGQGYLELQPLHASDDSPRFVYAPVANRIEPTKFKAVVVKDKPEDALMRLYRAADAYVHPDPDADLKRLRLQKERRANQQHFRHHGAKR